MNPTKNQKGGLNSMIEALVFLLMAIIVFYVVMVVWQPITSLNLFPLLNNTEAFGSYGPTTVLILMVFPLVAGAAILLAFFNHSIKGERPPQGPYY